MKNDGKFIELDTVVLTFSSTTKPVSVRAAYLNLRVGSFTQSDRDDAAGARHVGAAVAAVREQEDVWPLWRPWSRLRLLYGP